MNWAGGCENKCCKPCESNVKTVFNVVSVNADPSTEPPNLSSVLSCYHDLGEVSSKSKATSLPPHRPYDYPIDLIPQALIPKGRLYSVSGPERKTQEVY